MKYATEIGSIAMIHIPSFIKTGSDTEELTGGYTDNMVIVYAYSHFFFKIRKVGWKQLWKWSFLK
jgi:hypothetical protein